jgi:hypothetical protein
MVFSAGGFSRLRGGKVRGTTGWLVFDRGPGGHGRPLVLGAPREGGRGGRCAGEVSLWAAEEGRQNGQGEKVAERDRGGLRLFSCSLMLF